MWLNKFNVIEDEVTLVYKNMNNGTAGKIALTKQAEIPCFYRLPQLSVANTKKKRQLNEK